MPRQCGRADRLHVRHHHPLATGRYITAIPASVLQFNAEHFSLKVLPVELPPRSRPTAIVKARNRMLSPIANLFIDYASDVAKTWSKANREAAMSPGC